MHQLSSITNRKFVDSVAISDLEIETDSGWQPINSIHKTIPYKIWKIKTQNNLYLESADTHILFDECLNEIFVKDLIPGKSKIFTKYGPDLVIDVIETNIEENMFDLSVNSSDHRFYSNNILSHNTAILNALSYALYGQALTNIKKENLINKINGKHMIVTVDFEKNGIHYRIERGRKPNVLKLFANDQEIKNDSNVEDDSQGDSRETQKSINQMLEMSHTMFKHLVALNTYSEPFLSMKAADQREIIEQLLGITILSEKAESLKLKIKETKDSLTTELAKIEAIKTANENIQKSINSLILKSKAWETKKSEDIESLGKAIVKLEQVDIDQELMFHQQLKKWDDDNTKLKNLQKQKATLDSASIQAEKTVKKYANEVEKLQNKTCPACDQALHDHKHESMNEIAEKNLQDSVTYLNKLSTDIKTIDDAINAIGKLSKKPITFYDTESEAFGHKNNLDNLEKQLTNRLTESNPYEEQIEELNSTAIQKIDWDIVNNLNKIKEHQEFLHKLLTNKDSFVRKKIIDQNLSYLNKRLNYYIDKVGLPHKVVFQNDLTVEITQLGKDLDFDNLSRGERNRLILSISFAFRDVWESLYQKINLLFIDELIDSGLDQAGIEGSLSVLKHMARTFNKNIWLISHRDELIGRVNNVLRVIKEGGFTSYEIQD